MKSVWQIGDCECVVVVFECCHVIVVSPIVVMRHRRIRVLTSPVTAGQEAPLDRPQCQTTSAPLQRLLKHGHSEAPHTRTVASASSGSGRLTLHQLPILVMPEKASFLML